MPPKVKDANAPAVPKVVAPKIKKAPKVAKPDAPRRQCQEILKNKQQCKRLAKLEHRKCYAHFAVPYPDPDAHVDISTEEPKEKKTRAPRKKKEAVPEVKPEEADPAPVLIPELPPMAVLA